MPSPDQQHAVETQAADERIPSLATWFTDQSTSEHMQALR
jgi:hypothetical protein